MSPDADSASTAGQRYGVIVHGIYATGVGRAGRNAWEVQLGQSGVGKIADETGGEYYSLGTQNLVSFKPYLDRLQKVLDNQYYLVFWSDPEEQGQFAARQHFNHRLRISKSRRLTASGFPPPMRPLLRKK